MQVLIDFVLCELFEFGLMQIDLNFINFWYQVDMGWLVLFDFGVVCLVEVVMVWGYYCLLMVGLDVDCDEVCVVVVVAGFLNSVVVECYGVMIDWMSDVVIVELNKFGLFDFGDCVFVGVLCNQGVEIVVDCEVWYVLFVDMLFVQCKISGIVFFVVWFKVWVDVWVMVVGY